MWRAWGKVEAGGALDVWMVPVPLAEVDKGEADVTGRFMAKGLEFSSVLESVAVLLDVGVTADIIWEVAVISVMRDSVGRSMAGVRVVVVNGGSVDVVLVGIGVDSVVMWSV